MRSAALNPPVFMIGNWFLHIYVEVVIYFVKNCIQINKFRPRDKLSINYRTILECRMLRVRICMSLFLFNLWNTYAYSPFGYQSKNTQLHSRREN